MKRLNGWQRIGVILSVAWIIGGGLWLLHLGTEDAIAPRVSYMHMCSELYQHSDPADGPHSTIPLRHALHKTSSSPWARHAPSIETTFPPPT